MKRKFLIVLLFAVITFCYAEQTIGNGEFIVKLPDSVGSESEVSHGTDGEKEWDVKWNVRGITYRYRSLAVSKYLARPAYYFDADFYEQIANKTIKTQEDIQHYLEKTDYVFYQKSPMTYEDESYRKIYSDNKAVGEILFASTADGLVTGGGFSYEMDVLAGDKLRHLSLDLAVSEDDLKEIPEFFTYKEDGRWYWNSSDSRKDLYKKMQVKDAKLPRIFLEFQETLESVIASMRINGKSVDIKESGYTREFTLSDFYIVEKGRKIILGHSLKEYDPSCDKKQFERLDDKKKDYRVFSYKWGKVYTVCSEEDYIVYGIEVNASGISIINGAGIGSDRDFVLEACGKPHFKKGNYWSYCNYDIGVVELGITFDAKEKVSQIKMFILGFYREDVLNEISKMAKKD